MTMCAITLAVFLGSSHHPTTLSTAGFVPGFGALPTTTAVVQGVAFARSAPRASSHRSRGHDLKHCPPVHRCRCAMAHTFNAARLSRAGEPVLGENGERNAEPVDEVPPNVGSGGLERDSMHMRRALELAAKGLGRTRPNPAVGCVILDKSGVVVGEGFHPRAGEPHAEVWAIRQAGERARGGTAYVTLEPCNHFGRTPPCTAALLDSGVARVVAGMVDPDPRTAGAGLRRLADAGLDVCIGVEAAACQALNAPFIHRILEKSCYGVLHCALDESKVAALADTRSENDLTLPSKSRCYMEYDAVVVEGRAGVAKLEACITSLPETVLRVAVFTSIDGPEEVEGKLAAVAHSEFWADDPSGLLIIAAVPEGSDTGDRDREPSSTREPIRSSLAARGITVVDLPIPPLPRNTQAQRSLPTPRTAGTTAGQSNHLDSEFEKTRIAKLAARVVSKELHERGLLAAAWDVGPMLASAALSEGHIQRAIVRRPLHNVAARILQAQLPSSNMTQPRDPTVPTSAIANSDRDHSSTTGSSYSSSFTLRATGGDAGVRGLELDVGRGSDMVVEALKALSGRAGVRIRGGVESATGGDGVNGAVEFIDVLVPAVSAGSPEVSR